MKKTLCISTHLYPTTGFGGPSISFNTLLDYFKNNNHEFTAVSATNLETYNNKDTKFHKIYFKSNFLLKYGWSFGLFIYLFKNLKNHENIIINGVTNFPLFLGIVLSNFFKKNVYIFTRGGLEVSRVNEWSLSKRYYYKLNIYFLDLINKNNKLTLVYQSQDEKNKSNVSSQKAIICSNYSEDFFKNYNKDFTNLNVLYVGRFSPEKGSVRLLELMEFFSENDTHHNTLSLAIASNDEVEELQKYASCKNIFIQYNLDKNELSKLYQNSNVIFFPSYKENFGNALVEGVASGLLPIVYEDTHWSVLLESKPSLSEFFLKNELSKSSRDLNLYKLKFVESKKIILDNFIRGKDFKSLLELIR
jgi:glycosyltransferase involved in cell wall biosynthesis